MLCCHVDSGVLLFLWISCCACRKDGLYMDRFEDMPDIEDLVSEAELAGED